MTEPPPPVNPTPARPTMKPLPVGWGITLIVVVLAVAAGIAALVVTRPKSQPIRACEAYVSAQLVAPATAKWSGEVWSEDRAEVTGDVDAQNTFGALVRSTFSCAMVKGPGGDWSVASGSVV